MPARAQMVARVARLLRSFPTWEPTTSVLWMAVLPMKAFSRSLDMETPARETGTWSMVFRRPELAFLISKIFSAAVAAFASSPPLRERRRFFTTEGSARLRSVLPAAICRLSSSSLKTSTIFWATSPGLSMLSTACLELPVAWVRMTYSWPLPPIFWMVLEPRSKFPNLSRSWLMGVS